MASEMIMQAGIIAQYPTEWTCIICSIYILTALI